MKLIICNNKEEIAIKASALINQQITQKPNSVLGLATGSTPLRTYELLIEAYNKKQTNWSKITTFNLDEYVGLNKNHLQSYNYYMNNFLFSKININFDNVNIVSGIGDLEKNIINFEKKLSTKSIDLQLLGLGNNGHIGFNEPGSSFNSETHIVNLTKNTIDSNSRFFDIISDVPKQAITMGIKTIMKADKILLLAYGINKATAIKHLLEETISEKWPCSVLQKHQNVIALIDKEAASLLHK